MFFSFARKSKRAAEAEALKRQGDAALHAGDAESAERHYRAALEGDPRQGGLLCNLGYALHGQGKNAEAKLRLEQALECDAALSDAHFLLARMAHMAGQFDAADAHFRAVLDTTPEHELAWFEYCHLLLDQNRLDTARQLIARAVLRFPDRADFHVYLGNLHLQAGATADAVAAFERGLALPAGNEVAAMANLTQALLAQGENVRAAEVASTALALAPQLADVRFSLAQALERESRDDEAMEHYRTCLQSDAVAPLARSALAHLLLRRKRYVEAQEVGADLPTHFLAAHALQEDGDTDSAMAAYRRVLDLQDDHVESLINLALLLHQQGKHGEALDLLRRAERREPALCLIQVNLGTVLLALGEDGQASAAYGRAVTLDPARLEAHHGLGVALLREGQIEAAWSAATRAAALDAAHPDVLVLQGDILLAQGKFDDAAQRFQAFKEARPRHAPIYIILAQALQRQKRHDAALAELRQAQALGSTDPALPLLLASSLIHTGAVDDAIGLLRQSIETDAANVDAHMLLGSALAEAARFDEARASYERALALDPAHVDARASCGLLCLLQGDFERGWDGYCLLTQSTGMVRLPAFHRPLWQNDAGLAGKSLLLYADQGMGDAMQFVRYVERIARMGGNIVLAVQPPLIDVMRTLPWPVEVVSKDAPLPATDFHSPLGHLPRTFATRLDSIPAPIPYLGADETRAAHWRERFAADDAGHVAKRVGVVWAGNPLFSGDRGRSIPFALLDKLLALPQCRFYSLQKEVRANDAAPLAAANIADLGPYLADFTETAAIIANLDLVVTVDTSVAHLAGAMGKPVWIMLPFSPDFRWLLERHDSPWYPSARLFRQRSDGDWAGVIDDITMTLETECKRL